MEKLSFTINFPYYEMNKFSGRVQFISFFLLNVLYSALTELICDEIGTDLGLNAVCNSGHSKIDFLYCVILFLNRFQYDLASRFSKSVVRHI